MSKASGKTPLYLDLSGAMMDVTASIWLELPLWLVSG